MIFYLTYNDAPSGIFSGQVIDVVKYIELELKTPIKLISFISVRNFLKNRSKIKQELPKALVLPMFPGIAKWRNNSFILSRLCAGKKPITIIARSVIACNLALKLKEKGKINKVIYDGRGAIAAEWKEYNVVTHPQLLIEIESLEKKAIINSDFRIAVSNQLIKYWQEKYSYDSEKHVVIPCTINKIFTEIQFEADKIQTIKKQNGYKTDDIVFIYSGSVSGWQSFNLLENFMRALLQTEQKNKLLFLSPENTAIDRLIGEFPTQVTRKQVSSNEMPNQLLSGDYGLLIRENSVTNKVASPVKFAEYLACGLKVIISENIGDYSELIVKTNCGYIDKNFNQNNSIDFETKLRLRNLALSHFTKTSFKEQYACLLSN